MSKIGFLLSEDGCVLIPVDKIARIYKRYFGPSYADKTELYYIYAEVMDNRRDVLLAKCSEQSVGNAITHILTRIADCYGGEISIICGYGLRDEDREPERQI